MKCSQRCNCPTVEMWHESMHECICVSDYLPHSPFTLKPLVTDSITMKINHYRLGRLWRKQTPVCFSQQNKLSWPQLHHFLFLHSVSQAGMSLLVHVGSVYDLPLKPSNFPRCGPWPSDENIYCSDTKFKQTDQNGRLKKISKSDIKNELEILIDSYIP